MGTTPGLANSKPGQTELLQIFTSNWNLSELEPNKKPWTFDHRTSSPSYNIFSIEFHLNSELMGSSQIIIKIWCDFFSKSNSIVLFASRFAVLFTFYVLRCSNSNFSCKNERPLTLYPINHVLIFTRLDGQVDSSWYKISTFFAKKYWFVEVQWVNSKWNENWTLLNCCIVDEPIKFKSVSHLLPNH